MSARSDRFKRVGLVWARRVSQVGCLLAFLFLLLRTGQAPGAAGQAGLNKLPYPSSIFLELDPLVAIGTAIASRSLYATLFWSLFLIGATILIGRFFCGWICPFGTLHHFVSWVTPSRKGMKRILRNHTLPYQKIKFYILVGFLVACLFGTLQIGLLDPICLMVRSVGLAIYPALQYGAARGFDALASSNVGVLQKVADGGHAGLGAVFASEQRYFHVTWLLGFLFVGFLFLNRFITRFWCRGICPLGALLGVLSRFAIFGMEKKHEACTDCNLCLVNCQGGDNPHGGVKHEMAECHLCFNCEAACPEDVIRFKFFPRREGVRPAPDLGRRQVLVGAVAGVAMVPLTRASDDIDANYNPKLIRPPGSLAEKEFLERCIKCGECMKVCPNNALHPAFLEGGIESIWSPILIARIGYCEYSCTLCGQACPTGAIRRITPDEKMGNPEKKIAPIKIGTAFYDKGRCLPWSMNTPCIVCEEFCPTSPKAIWAQEVEVPVREKGTGHASADKKQKLKQPVVQPDLCIGCGACEKVCPVQDQPAVYVTSIGETRSKTNVLLLENTKYS